MTTTCIHCRCRAVFRRGICRTCHTDLRIRFRHERHNQPEDDVTAAEVEATVAEQSKPENLPAWWQTESERAYLVRECVAWDGCE